MLFCLSILFIFIAWKLTFLHKLVYVHNACLSNLHKSIYGLVFQEFSHISLLDSLCQLQTCKGQHIFINSKFVWINTFSSILVFSTLIQEELTPQPMGWLIHKIFWHIFSLWYSRSRLPQPMGWLLKKNPKKPKIFV